METSYGIGDVRAVADHARRAGRRIAFVPTMGNLHAGHLALVKKARETADFTIVSIFVNPFQFGEGEDYASYPRTLDDDIASLIESGNDFLFVPSVDDLYPDGLDRVARIEVPELSEILCGEFRPGFFRGVTTVVGMLLNLAQPDVAIFGEKDYQQLVIIRRMVRDLHLPVEIMGVPTMREDDGLAMSSRNGYLSEAERRRAPVLYRTLCEARDAIQAGDNNYPVLEAVGLHALEGAGFRPDYFAIRSAVDLAEAEENSELRVLSAAWLGTARLIDNIPVGRP